MTMNIFQQWICTSACSVCFGELFSDCTCKIITILMVKAGAFYQSDCNLFFPFSLHLALYFCWVTALPRCQAHKLSLSVWLCFVFVRSVFPPYSTSLSSQSLSLLSLVSKAFRLLYKSSCPFFLLSSDVYLFVRISISHSTLSISFFFFFLLTLFLPANRDLVTDNPAHKIH